MTDDGGFEAFYRTHHPRLVASVLLTTGDLEVAREAVDEACARALARWDRVSAMDAPAGWTYRVALNVARRQYRRRRLEARLLAGRAVPAAAPPEVDDTRRLLAGLAPRQRTAVVLRFVADLTEPEIAAAMGIRRSTVSATLAAARVRLARDLADDRAHERADDRANDGADVDPGSGRSTHRSPLPGGPHG
jgi:RNA polymerase sigma factor (sigma-70 family)